MRGKDCTDSDTGADTGITPAYAGKSSAFLRVHLMTLGSPPPMRGKGLFDSDTGADTGITPAYAGKRLLECIIAQFARDHPRLCGEKSYL